MKSRLPVPVRSSNPSARPGKSTLNPPRIDAHPALSYFLAAAGVILLIFLLPILNMEQASSEPDRIVIDEISSKPTPPPPPPPSPSSEPSRETKPISLPDLRVAFHKDSLEVAPLDILPQPEYQGNLAIDTSFSFESKPDAVREMQIFQVENLDNAPVILHQPPPQYPYQLERRGVAGSASILFQVDETGEVVHAEVSKATHAAFGRAAVKAVRQWRFEPGTHNGRKVKFWMEIPLRFEMN